MPIPVSMYVLVDENVDSDDSEEVVEVYETEEEARDGMLFLCKQYDDEDVPYKFMVKRSVYMLNETSFEHLEPESEEVLLSKARTSVDGN